jgi:predicted O-linked N-acetylglucosamine transferase (SPINDLY family)
VNALPASRNGHITFGCLNNFCKVNESVLRLWARVLLRVPDARLILLSEFGSHRQSTLQFFADHGVPAHRLEFVPPLPRKDYLAEYYRLDLILDTFPYNGHTTSLDALWMGIPIVSLVGRTPVSRAGLSQLSNLGLPELAAHSEDQYIRIASDLAGDFSRLADLRASLRPRMESSVLMDAPRFARQIESVYRTLWRHWCQHPAEA